MGQGPTEPPRRGKLDEASFRTLLEGGGTFHPCLVRGVTTTRTPPEDGATGGGCVWQTLWRRRRACRPSTRRRASAMDSSWETTCCPNGKRADMLWPAHITCALECCCCEEGISCHHSILLINDNDLCINQATKYPARREP